VSPAGKSDFRRYIEQFGSLPPDTVLGHTVLYSVGDGEYDGVQMAAEFARLGLSPKFLPGDINPADAFEKATKSLDNTRYALNPPNIPGVSTDHYAVILMREARRDKTKIVRHAIREIRDSKHAVLQYDQVAEFEYYKPVTRSGKVDYSSWRVRPTRTLQVPASSEEDAALTALMQKFDAQMDRYLHTHDGQKIRTLIREYLVYLNAITLKSSAYFVHNTRTSELLALQEFCRGLGVPRTDIMLIPMVDLPGLRTEVVEAFEVQAFNDLMGVKAAVEKLRAARTGPISPAAFMKLKEQYDDVLAKANEHSRVLDVVQNTTSDAALVALQAITDLGAEVAAGLAGGTP
jgi:hypothetical protein